MHTASVVGRWLPAAWVLLTLLTTPGAAAGPLAVVAPTGVSGSVSDHRRAVQDLRAQVDALGGALADAVMAWEQGQSRLDELRQREYDTGRSAELGGERVRGAQQRLDALARATYQQPGHPGLSAVLDGDLQALSDYRYLQRGLSRISDDRAADIRELTAAKSSAEQLQEQQTADRLAAQQLQTALDAELERLQQLATDSESQLRGAAAALARAEADAANRRAATAAAARVEAEQAARRRAAASSLAPLAGAASPAGATCAGTASQDFVNGFMPAESLCALSAPGHRLEYAAANQFNAMTAAYEQQFGQPLCVTDSYRDYAGQVDVFRRKPGLAATPGRSQHGLGRALDLCGGVQVFGSAAHRWMQENAGRFGFVHPPWARSGGSRPEAWHWEYAG